MHGNVKQLCVISQHFAKSLPVVDRSTCPAQNYTEYISAAMFCCTCKGPGLDLNLDGMTTTMLMIIYLYCQ